MKLALAILLALSLGLNGWLAWVLKTAHEVNLLQAEAIKADQDYWAAIQTKPVFLWKHPATGNIFIGVPYREKPILFKGVCMQERRL